MCSACRFCLSVYLDLSPRGMRVSPIVATGAQLETTAELCTSDLQLLCQRCSKPRPSARPLPVIVHSRLEANHVCVFLQPTRLLWVSRGFDHRLGHAHAAHAILQRPVRPSHHA